MSNLLEHEGDLFQDGVVPPLHGPEYLQHCLPLDELVVGFDAPVEDGEGNCVMDVLLRVRSEAPRKRSLRFIVII